MCAEKRTVYVWVGGCVCERKRGKEGVSESVCILQCVCVCVCERLCIADKGGSWIISVFPSTRSFSTGKPIRCPGSRLTRPAHLCWPSDEGTPTGTARERTGAPTPPHPLQRDLKVTEAAQAHPFQDNRPSPELSGR